MKRSIIILVGTLADKERQFFVHANLTSDEYPDARVYTVEKKAISDSKDFSYHLNCVCTVIENYSLESQRVIGVSDHGTWRSNDV